MKKVIPENSIPYRILYLVGQFLIRSFEKIIAFFVPNKKYFDSSEFPWVEEIESEWHLMQAELNQLLKERNTIPDVCDISEEQLKVVDFGEWQSFAFLFHGQKIENNCKRCPESYRLMQKIPRIKTALFSILESNVEIAEHRGPFKGYLRYHLGLKIPKEKEKCALRLGGEVRHWEEGKSLIFDDTFNHDAWNKSDETRVVLFVDFIRPMPKPLVYFSEFLVFLLGKSPYVKNALLKLEMHEKKTPKGDWKERAKSN